MILQLQVSLGFIELADGWNRE